MKNLTKLALVPATVLSMNTAMAGLSAVSIKSETQVRVSEEDSSIRSSKHSFSVRLSEGIKAVIKAELKNGLQKEGFSDDNRYKDLIEEAYLVFHGNDTFTAVFGKKAVQFGKESKLSGSRDTLAYGLKAERYPVAVTVKLNQEQILGLKLSASAFETGKVATDDDDSRIGQFDGLSISAGKDITSNAKVYVTYVSKGNGDNDAEEESRVVAGVTYSMSGWTLGAEGLWLTDNPDFPEADFAFIISAAKKMSLLGEKGEFVAEYTSINKDDDAEDAADAADAADDEDVEKDIQSELTLEYKISINKNIVIAPGLRRTVDADDESDTAWMLNMIYKFQVVGNSQQTLLQ